jgi:hypothetical protein
LQPKIFIDDPLNQTPSLHLTTLALRKDLGPDLDPRERVQEVRDLEQEKDAGVGPYPVPLGEPGLQVELGPPLI